MHCAFIKKGHIRVALFFKVQYNTFSSPLLKRISIDSRNKLRKISKFGDSLCIFKINVVIVLICVSLVVYLCEKIEVVLPLHSCTRLFFRKLRY